MFSLHVCFSSLSVNVLILTHISCLAFTVICPRGHFGQVCKVRERSTGTYWAGKFLKLRRSACSRLGLERSSVEREVEILQAVQHENIVTLNDVFESRAEVVLILEL